MMNYGVKENELKFINETLNETGDETSEGSEIIQIHGSCCYIFVSYFFNVAEN